MIIFKKDFRKYLLHELLPTLTLPKEAKEKIVEVCSNFESFRSHVGFKGAKVLPPQSWRAGWPASADAFVELVEDQ